MAGRGNPKPTGSKPDKLMRDALVVALNREAESADGKPTKKLAVIAEALVDKAAGGDVAAATFIADRVDGRPHQTADVTVFRAKARELSDDDLASYIPNGSGDGADVPSVDPSQLN